MIRLNTPGDSGGEVDKKARFERGQLVKHVRYGYRGVVVDLDMTCQADEDWYAKNKTQPSLDQPWYHVLVDGSTATTYAAQTSLMADETFEPISHLWLNLFFSGFDGRGYTRNDVPWEA